MATVYAVASSKGGVGKTTTTVNLGATLASAGLSVAVVDGDLGMANLGDALGVEPDGATLHDVLAETAEIEDAIYDGPHGVAVVPGDTSIDGFRAAEPANLTDVLAALDDYDYVLVDTGAGLSHDTVLPLGLADEVILVSTTERDSLTDTEKTRQVVDRLGGVTRGVVLTRVDPDDPNADEVAERLDAEVIEAIPADPTVGESMRLADPLPSHAPDSPAASAYRALAGGLTGESIPTPAAVADAGSSGGIADGRDHGDTTDDPRESGETEGADGDGSLADDAGDTDTDEAGITLGTSTDETHGDDGITLGDSEDTVERDAAAADPVDADDLLAADDAEPDLEADPTANDETDGREGVAAEADERETFAIEADESPTADDAESDDLASSGNEPATETADDTGGAIADGVETDESEADGAGDPSGLTDDDALAADTSPSDDPLVADSPAPADDESADDDGDAVFTTSLVEEAEPSEKSADEGDDQSEDGEPDAADENFVETDEGDDDDDDGGKGFLGRLLG
jgi:septum site-determining protein MinD